MKPEAHYPCTCNAIEEMLSDPDLGLTMREDGIYVTEAPNPWVFYYCQQCEGALPNIWNAGF